MTTPLRTARRPLPPAAAVLLALAAALHLAACGSRTPDALYQSALADLHAGRTAPAAESLAAALAAEPDAPFAPEAWNWLGLARAALGDQPAATEAFETAVRLNPAAFAPVYNLGSLLLDANRPDRAIPLLRRAADLDPADVTALLRISDYMLRQGRRELASRTAFAAQKRDPSSPAVATAIGRIALLDGHAEQAETAFMQALEADKTYPPALYNLGVLHALSPGHAEQAAAYFRRYLEADPSGPRAAAAADRIGGAEIPQASFPETKPAPQKTESPAELWKQAAKAQSASDPSAPALAVRALEAAADLPDPSPLPDEIARRSLALFPNSAPVLLAVGTLWEKRGNLPSALAALTRASAAAPDDPSVLLALSRVADAREEYDTSLMALRRLVQLEPGNADALWSLADCFGTKLGMTSKGIAAYRDFERLFPSDPRTADIPSRITDLETAAENPD
jgi:tetratricopeptide (TPR) repeat protein